MAGRGNPFYGRGWFDGEAIGRVKGFAEGLKAGLKKGEVICALGMVGAFAAGAGTMWAVGKIKRHIERKRLEEFFYSDDHDDTDSDDDNFDFFLPDEIPDLTDDEPIISE